MSAPDPRRTITRLRLHPHNNKEHTNHMTNIFITMGIAAIKTAIKNPEKRVKLRQIMLDLFNAIRLAYADDPEFQ